MTPLKRPPLHAQRGVLSVITPLLVVAILFLTLLGIDATRLYLIRNGLQLQIDAAALAAADSTRACGGQTVAQATLQQRAAAAADSHGFSGAAADLVISTGVLTHASDSDYYQFDTRADIDQSNAVFITYSRAEPVSRFFPDLLGTIELKVSSVAQKEVVTTLSSGNSNLSLSGGLLGGILAAVFNDPGYTLDPTDVESWRDTYIQIGDLAGQLGITEVSDLTSADPLDFVSALDTLFSSTPGLAEVFNNLAGSDGLASVAVSDILQVGEDVMVPGVLELNGYELLQAVLFNVAKAQVDANADTISLSVDPAELGIPLDSQINSLAIELYVSEAPSIAIGPARKDSDGNWITQFRSAEMGLQLQVNASTAPISLLGLIEFQVENLTIPLAIQLGATHGSLVSASCARGTANNVDFSVLLERHLLAVASGTLDSDTGDINEAPIAASTGTVVLLSGLLAPQTNIVQISAEVGVTLEEDSDEVFLGPDYPLYCPSGHDCAEYQVESPFSSLDIQHSDIHLNQIEFLQTSYGGIDLTSLQMPITDAVETLLQDVITSLFDSIVSPLEDLLGVGAGQTSVTVTNAHQSRVTLIETDRVVI